MRMAWLLCGVALTLSTGVEAQTRAQREEARRQQQEQLRMQREEERARRDAFLAELRRVEREGGLTETVGADRISFAAGDAMLSKDAELVLIRTVHWLRLHPGRVLQLQERCSEPITPARLALSNRRTQRVSDFLVDYSASADRVQRRAPVMAPSGEEVASSSDPCAVFLSATPTN